MATALQHHLSLIGGTVDANDARPSPSGADNGTRESDELEVIITRTLHTFTLLWSRDHDLEFAAIQRRIDQSFEPTSEVTTHIADIQRLKPGAVAARRAALMKDSSGR